MANAMVALATTTLGSTASSVTFGSIPATYRDLRLVISGTGSGGSSVCLVFNADTGSNYSFVRMWGDGSTGQSGSGSPRAFAYAGDFGSAQSNVGVDIMDYSATDKHKTVLSRANIPNQYVFAVASRWGNTAAITSVNAYLDGTTWASGTTFSLYGIVSA